MRGLTTLALSAMLALLGASPTYGQPEVEIDGEWYAWAESYIIQQPEDQFLEIYEVSESSWRSGYLVGGFSCKGGRLFFVTSPPRWRPDVSYPLFLGWRGTSDHSVSFDGLPADKYSFLPTTGGRMMLPNAALLLDKMVQHERVIFKNESVVEGGGSEDWLPNLILRGIRDDLVRFKADCDAGRAEAPAWAAGGEANQTT